MHGSRDAASPEQPDERCGPTVFQPGAKEYRGQRGGYAGGKICVQAYIRADDLRGMDQSFFGAKLPGLLDAPIGTGARRAEAAAELEREGRGHQGVEGLVCLLRGGVGKDGRSKSDFVAGDERGVPARDRAQQ